MSLPTKERITSIELASGMKWDYSRQSGRSLGIALKTIGDAMISELTPIEIRNHSVEGHAANTKMNQILAKTIQEIINKLELESLTIYKNSDERFFIRYDYNRKG